MGDIMTLVSRGIALTLQTAATTGNGVVATIRPGTKDITITVTGAGTISGGTVSIEEASSESYAGTWSIMEDFPATDLTGGAQKVLHFKGRYNAIRCRLASIAGGGTVSSELMAD